MRYYDAEEARLLVEVSRARAGRDRWLCGQRHVGLCEHEIAPAPLVRGSSLGRAFAREEALLTPLRR